MSRFVAQRKINCKLFSEAVPGLFLVPFTSGASTFSQGRGEAAAKRCWLG